MKEETQVRRTLPETINESCMDVFGTSDCSEENLSPFKDMLICVIATIQHVPRTRKTT